MKNFNINKIVVSNDNKFFLIAGPCQIESDDHAQMLAGSIKEICDSLSLDLIMEKMYNVFAC